MLGCLKCCFRRTKCCSDQKGSNYQLVTTAAEEKVVSHRNTTFEVDEEVTMETTAVTTEQPQSAEPEMTKRESSAPAAEGSSVDQASLVDLSPSLSQKSSPKSVPSPCSKEDGVDVSNVMVPQGKGDEGSVLTGGRQNLDNGPNAGFSLKDSSEGPSKEEKALKKTSGGGEHQVCAEELASIEGGNVGTGLEASAHPQGKIEALSNLAEQIEQFDPESLLPKQREVSKELESTSSEFHDRDLNDDRLIDDLVKGDNFVKQTDIPVEKDVDMEERETTVDDTSNGDDENLIGVSDLDVTDATAAEVENGGVGSTNGSMSTSTESEGFTEDQAAGKPEEEQPEAENPASATSIPDKAEEETQPKPTETTTANTSEPSEKQKSESIPATKEKDKAAKSKKKEDKSIEHILRALSSLQTTEEKLAALCKKYADLHEDHRILQATFKQNQRKLTVVTREKDQLQSEHTKAVMAKSKLESLCRELQKHNQIIRQESLQRAKDEDEKRKEISQKFQTTIGEIQEQMQDNHDRNKKLREENFELASKLKKFIEQYEAREKQVEKVMQHRELEQKLADAKLEQATAILMEEKGRSQKEKEVLIIQSTEYMKKMQLKEAELKMYKDRYEEFQSTISKSEEMFQKFKTEMDKMTKRIKKLEKEGAQWRSKWENANRALLAMAEEKTKYDREKPTLLSKISKLESLCRAMQAERQARRVLESEGLDISKLDTFLDKTKTSDNPTEGPSVPNGSPAEPEEAATDKGGSPQEAGEEGPTKGDVESVAGTEDSVDSEATAETVIHTDSGKEEAPPQVAESCQSGTSPEQPSQSEPTTEQPSQSESSTEQPSQSEPTTEQPSQSDIRSPSDTPAAVQSDDEKDASSQSGEKS